MPLPQKAGAAELWRRARSAAGAFVTDGAFRGLSALGRLHPRASPRRHGVERIRDVPYRAGGLPAHRLDVYRPARAEGPRPTMIYLHGGGFRILSKDTHWLMGLAYARRGFVVFNVDYRLGPSHPYPAPLEDACAALAWVHRHGAAFGADPGRIFFAGESAGGNLAVSLAVAASYRRPEPFAREIFDLGVRPAGVVCFCGLLQVSDCARFARRRPLSPFLLDRLVEVERSYLSGASCEPGELADPLVVLERGAPPDRPFPPVFAPVGTRDPILDDTRRLGAALARLGVPCETRYYPGEIHAFHALLWRESARRCWRESYAFLDSCLAARARVPGDTASTEA